VNEKPPNRIQRNSQPQDFEKSYPHSHDLWAAKRQALASFGIKFPESKHLLKAGLEDLKSIRNSGTSGQSIPIRLRDHSGESDYSPAVVKGEFTPMSHALLEMLYKLTGSNVVRDDRKDGEEHGYVIRQGAYNDQDLFFVEHYKGTDETGERFVTVVNGKLGEHDLQQLSASEEQNFKVISGMDIDSGGDVEFFPGLRGQYDITKNNYEVIALGLVAQANKLEVAKGLGRLLDQGDLPPQE
jgi:hypothetical protein